MNRFQRVPISVKLNLGARAKKCVMETYWNNLLLTQNFHKIRNCLIFSILSKDN